MKLRDLIEREHLRQVVEIRDEENMPICRCNTGSKGVLPYLDCELEWWFVALEPLSDEVDFVAQIRLGVGD